jgi:hypothetical protein
MEKRIFYLDGENRVTDGQGKVLSVAHKRKESYTGGAVRVPRTDVWFRLDGQLWWGWQAGDTCAIRCQTVKQEPRPRRITCDRCELMRINGIVCHEIGCPNSRK